MTLAEFRIQVDLLLAAAWGAGRLPTGLSVEAETFQYLPGKFIPLKVSPPLRLQQQHSLPAILRLPVTSMPLAGVAITTTKLKAKE